MIKHFSSLKQFVLAAVPLLLAVPAAHAIPITYTASLNGSNENPPHSSSPGTGNAIVVLDTVSHTLRVEATFADLTALDTAAHIHCCIVPPGNTGIATPAPAFSGFPLGVTSGIYDMTFDTTLASTFNPAFVTANGGTAAGAEAALATGLNAGLAYFNIHTTAFPGGEIRGFLQTVPEPESYALMGIGLVGVAFAVRRRKIG